MSRGVVALAVVCIAFVVIMAGLLWANWPRR